MNVYETCKVKTLMDQPMCEDFLAISAQGESRAGQKSSCRDPLSKGLFLQIGKLQHKTECIEVI